MSKYDWQTEFSRQIRSLPVLDLKAESKHEAISEILDDLVSYELIEHGTTNVYLRGALSREERGSTGIGGGFAIPHVWTDLKIPVIRLARSKSGIDWQSLDGEPVHVVFFRLVTMHKTGDDLRMLEHFSRVIKNDEVYHVFLEGDSCMIADLFDKTAL